MTFHSPITAASPIALAASFIPPVLNRERDSAVVTVRKALDRLPAEVREGTLDELAGIVIGKDLFPLPSLPAGVSAELAALAQCYTQIFIRDEVIEGEDLWEDAAQAIARFRPVSAADLAVTLMYGLHYLHPAKLSDGLAIDTGHFGSSTAGQILINTMLSLLTDAKAPAGSLTSPEWDRLMSEWYVARAQYKRLGEVQSEAERRYSDAKPQRPVEPDTTKCADLENIENMTIAQIKAAAGDRHPAWVAYDAEQAAFETRCDELRVSTGLAEAEAAWTEAVDECARRANALLNFPAPDVSYIARKLAVFHEEYGPAEIQGFDAIMTDITRLQVAEVAH